MKSTIAIILAGGHGIRMGEYKLPKQFIKIDGKPVFVYTIEKFLGTGLFDKIVVPVAEAWIPHATETLRQFIKDDSNIVFIKGKNTRVESTVYAIDYIKQTMQIDDETIIVIHDAVRPFVSKKIIQANVGAALKHNVISTAVPLTESIVESKDFSYVDSFTDRKDMYVLQTPQTFCGERLSHAYSKLTSDEKSKVYDLCEIMRQSGEKVYLVEGDMLNLKITFSEDVKIAEGVVMRKKL